MPIEDISTKDALRAFIRQVVGVRSAATGRPLRSGIVPVVFAAANFSNIVTVPHDLGVLPDIEAVAASIGQNAIYAQIGNVTTTSFDVQGCSPFALATQTTPIHWFARG